MIPNMSDVLTDFEQIVQLKTTTQTIVNYRPVISSILTSFRAVVQPADKQNLQVADIDMSKEYLLIHSKTGLKINDIVVYKGKDYIIKTLGDFSDYGYYESIAEEVK